MWYCTSIVLVGILYRWLGFLYFPHCWEWLRRLLIENIEIHLAPTLRPVLMFHFILATLANTPVIFLPASCLSIVRVKETFSTSKTVQIYFYLHFYLGLNIFPINILISFLPHHPLFDFFSLTTWTFSPFPDLSSRNWKDLCNPL